MKVKNNSITAKIRRLMRICVAQTMIAILLCGISMANTGYAQLLDKEITISLKDVPLEIALLELGKIAEVKFAYSLDQLNVKSNVSVQADRTPLREVLDELLSPYEVRYKVGDRDSTIFLKRVNSKNPQQSLNIESGINSQLYQITGIVTDVNGQPMAGVNIVVKGTTNGTTSNSEGRYIISVASEDDILVFSFIGYASVEVKVNSQAEINVVLIEDVGTLKEVFINAGYWEVKERDNTGSISKISAANIEKQPVNNVLQSLQGRLTGVYITQSSGIPGSNINVQIRGRNSIASSNAPLYLVDGVPFTSSTLASPVTSGSLHNDGSSPLSIIPAESIESIEVLKDADATAIYGSRGANGVILITTKKSKKGALTVRANLSTGHSEVGRRMDLMNTKQYLSMRKEAFRNDNIVPTATTAPDVTVWDSTRYTDWQKELVGGKANFTNLTASISAGTKDTQFLFNNTFQTQGSVYPGDFHYQRGSSQVSVTNSSFADRLKTNISISYAMERNNLLAQDLMTTALSLAPNAPRLFNDSGKLNWENSTWTNPLAYLEQSYQATGSNLMASSSIGYAVLPNLELKSSFSYTEYRFTDRTFVPSAFFNPALNLTSENASANFNNGSQNSWIIEPQISYYKQAGKHEVNTLLGTTFQNTDRQQLVQNARGFSSDALIGDLNAAFTTDIVGYTYTKYRYAAIFARLNYKYNHKYIVNLTARRDGSSRFGPGKQFANFAAVGVAWLFSEEGFVKNNVPFLSFGKLRASYGSTGNDQITDYGYLDTYGSSGKYQGITGLTPTALFNPNYGWELNRKFEVALETSFFDDRLSFQANYYRNRSSNQLIGYPLPLTTGFPSIQANLSATVENSGLEFEFSSQNINKNSFTWTTGIVLTIPRNELVEFPDLEASTYSTRYVVGKPLNISKRYKLLGVNPETGVYDFADMNGDGVISTADRLEVVELGQRYYGGIMNSVSYKGLSFEIFLQYVNQYGNGYQALTSTYPGRIQQPANVLGNQWTTAGDLSIYQRFAATNSTVSTAQSRFRDSNAVVENASFLRIKNVFISYQLPKRWLKDLHCKLFLQGQNLLTLTDYSGLDPEGMNISLPALRTYTIGIQFTL